MRSATALACLLLIGGCGRTHQPGYAVTDSVATAPEAAGFQTQQVSFTRPKLYLHSGVVARDEVTSTPVPRSITRQATLHVIVANPESAAVALTAQVEAMGGYVEDARQWHAGGRVLATLSLRVPEQLLDSTIHGIHRTAIDVDDETRGGQDVTQESADLDAQLTNLRATETELRALLASVRQRSQKASDILDVFEKLADVRQSIEQIEAQASVLGRMVRLATIKIELVPDTPDLRSAGGWHPTLTARRALETLVGTLHWLLDAGIWVGLYVLPVVVALAVPVGIVGVVVRGMRRRGGAEAATS